MRKIQDLLDQAFKQNLLSEPPLCSTVFIIADTDGCIVSVAVSHELMEDEFSTSILRDVMEQLLMRRKLIRDEVKDVQASIRGGTYDTNSTKCMQIIEHP